MSASPSRPLIAGDPTVGPSVCFATCAPGLEPVLHRELQALRMPKVERQVGGVRFTGGPADWMRANLWLRTAGRVLLRLTRYEAHGSEALYAGALECEWERWLRPGGTVRVDAQSKDSDLDHTRFVEQRIKDAIVDRVTRRGAPRPQVVGEEAHLRVHAHVYRNRVTLSLDSSGAALRKRGWRNAQGQAPLSETLAAAMVQLSGWNGKAPLVDPFCGSGTLLVEGALWATNTAPGLLRERFGFMAWPGFSAKLWERERKAAEAARRPLGKTRLVGLDHRPERIAEAQANLTAAGFSSTDLQVLDARAWAGKPGWNAQILTNPPYGVRVGEEAKMLGLYEQLGQHWKAVAQGYGLTLIAPIELLPAFGLAWEQQVPVKNGALECAIVSTQLPESESAAPPA